VAFDPYAELGVPRTATEADVRKAYRKKAKTTHPDTKDGDADAFDRARTAMLVLTDHQRRDHFDKTGRVDDVGPDNKRAAALQIIENHQQVVVNSFLQGRGPDPRNIDMLLTITNGIKKEILEHEAGLVAGQKVLDFTKDYAKRFKLKTGDTKDDPIAALVNQRINQGEQQMAGIREGIEVRQLAMEIIARYEFRWEMPEPQMFDLTAGGILTPRGPRTS
jgi:curved DNA-binding protein CbpA